MNSVQPLLQTHLRIGKYLDEEERDHDQLAG